MGSLFPEKSQVETPPPPATTMIDDFSAVRRQYQRAREFAGVTLDEIVNSRRARNHLNDLWLLGCMVRKPEKARVLPRMRIETWRA